MLEALGGRLGMSDLDLGFKDCVQNSRKKERREQKKEELGSSCPFILAVFCGAHCDHMESSAPFLFLCVF